MRRFSVTIRDYDTGEIIHNFMGHSCYFVAVGQSELKGTVAYHGSPRFVLEIGSGAVRRGLYMYDKAQVDLNIGITSTDEENNQIQ